MKLNLKNIPFSRILLILLLVGQVALISLMYPLVFERVSPIQHVQVVNSIQQMQYEMRAVLSSEDSVHHQVEALTTLSGNIDTAFLALQHGGTWNQDGLEEIDEVSTSVKPQLFEANDQWSLVKQAVVEFSNTPAFIDSSIQQFEIVETITDTGLVVDSVLKTEQVTIANPALASAKEGVYQQLLQANDNGLALVNELKAQELVTLDRRKIWFWALVFVMIGFAIVMVSMANRFFMNPIKKLEKDMKRVLDGHYEHQTNVDGGSEIGRLGAQVNEVGEHLSKISNFVESFSNQDYNYKEPAFAKQRYAQNKLVQNLLKTQEELNTTFEESGKREWINEGFAKFGEILQSNSNDITQLSQAVISNLVKHLGINQGGLFIWKDGVEGEEGRLILAAAYAYEREKFLKRELKAGQGLAGATYLEGKTNYMTNIPEDFAFIQSSTGSASPKSVLMVPLISNDASVGVLELASFNEMEPHEITFVESLGETIATTIANVNTNEQTRKLYEDSQEQAHKMHEQEEEMRQSMEELFATQEEFTRKERKYQERIRELEELTGGKE